MANDPRREAMNRLRNLAQSERCEDDMNTSQSVRVSGTLTGKAQGPRRPSRQTNGLASRPISMLLHHSAIRTDMQLMHPRPKERLHQQLAKDKPESHIKENPVIDSYEMQRERQRLLHKRYEEAQKAQEQNVTRNVGDNFLTPNSVTPQPDEDYVLAEKSGSDDESNQRSNDSCQVNPVLMRTSSEPETDLTSNQLLDELDERFWSNFYGQENDKQNDNKDERPSKQQQKHSKPSSDISLKSKASTELRRTTEIKDGNSPIQSRTNDDSTTISPFDDKDNATILNSRSIVFVAVGVALGIGGFFLEELSAVRNRLIETTPFLLSRQEQQQLTQRLDRLQQEFVEFRAARDHVESQSQRLVHEVQEHLEHIKLERERYQQMIIEDMQAMRTYVKQLTEEIVENEKNEIRKRLVETISASLPYIEDIPEEELDIMSTSETMMMTISSSDGTINDPTTQHVITDNSSIDETAKEGYQLLVAWQLILIVLAMSLLTGLLGLRVRNMRRRKKWLQDRRRHQWQQASSGLSKDNIAEGDAPLTRGESGVETLSYMNDDTDGNEPDNDASDSDTERSSALKHPGHDSALSNQHETLVTAATSLPSAMDIRQRTRQMHADTRFGSSSLSSMR